MSWWDKFSEKKWIWLVVAALAINHLVGLIGLHSPQAKLFEQVTWLNLLLSFIVVASAFTWKGCKFIFFTIAAFCIGMAVEITGVITGWPFGNYYYTETLGYSLKAVPLIIGLNWVLLSLSCGGVSNMLPYNKWIKMLSAGLLMVGIDVLLEPFAIAHHLWVWKGSMPGMANYVSWFFTTALIQMLYQWLVTSPRNYLPVIYCGILILFLAADKILC